MFQNFIRKYDSVYLYGTSMGGFGALIFSDYVTKPHILAYAPQSTLNPEKAPWDMRYPAAKNLDWHGKNADAADKLNITGKTLIVYDPFDPVDARHVARLPQDNIIHLKTPFLWHKTAKHLSHMGLLKEILHHFIEGDLQTWFPKVLRARKSYTPYLSNAYLNQARRFEKQRKYKNALLSLEKSLEHNPNNQHAADMSKRVEKEF